MHQNIYSNGGHFGFDYTHTSLNTYQTSETSPRSLIYAQVIQDGREHVSLLRPINVYWISSQDVHSVVVEGESQVVRDLPAHGYNHAAAFLCRSIVYGYRLF